jgi:hypothetical protein
VTLQRRQIKEERERDMWIRLSKNMHDISCDMQAMTTEELKEFAKDQKNVVKLLTGAYEAAEAVWKVHPEFKTVLLDTCSKEELVMLQQAKQGKGGQA